MIGVASGPLWRLEYLAQRAEDATPDNVCRSGGRDRVFDVAGLKHNLEQIIAQQSAQDRCFCLKQSRQLARII